MVITTVKNMSKVKQLQKDELVELGDELEVVQDAIEGKKAELKELQDLEDKLYGEILPNMQGRGLDMVRTSSGLTYILVSGRKTFTIKKGMEQTAITWAQTNFPGILSINKSDLAKVLKPMLEVPAFFEEKVGEPHLSVRTQNDE